jgi:CO/xanthine dehydrogenase FAD-binding subunit
MRNVLIPRTLSELWLFMENEPEAAVYAGGTDLLVKLHKRGIKASTLICLERIEELRAVKEEPDGILIGAAATHSRLIDSAVINKHLPVLVEALKTLGSPLIRNMGTIGGNICHASPAADSLPPLYVLDAAVELRSRDKFRTVPLAAFITGPGETALEKGEIMTGIRVAKPEGFNVHHFAKVGQRKAMSIAIASMAALLKISGSGIVEEARLAWGSVGPMVVRSGNVEAAIVGERLSVSLCEKVSLLAGQAVSPIDDLRASADYRRTVAGNLLTRLAAITEPASS